MLKFPRLFILLLLLCLCAFSCSRRSDFEIRNDRIRALIKTGSDSINVKAYFPDRDVRNYLHGEFDQFYKDRDYDLAWLNFDHPKKQADELLEALDKAPTHGLRSENYELSRIEKLLSGLYNIHSAQERRKKWRSKLVKTKEFKQRLQEEDTARFEDIAQLDFLLTASYLTYASHLLSGRIDPNEEKEWFAPQRTADLSAHLEEALKHGDIKSSLEALAPSHEQYALLRTYLSHFRDMEQDTLPKILKTLQRGDHGSNVLLAKKRLSKWKNIDPNLKDSTVYDGKMTDAVKQFQAFNGLKPTGSLDQETLGLLNLPPSYWISKIETNMERMRWLQDDFGDKYILVNIPAYELKVVNRKNVDLKMKVIVGTNYKKTPVFSDNMEYIVFNPYWTVPNSIAIEEMLPILKKNPGYLTKKNYKLYDVEDPKSLPIVPEDVMWSELDSASWHYRIVESPGPGNSLGRIKFMMPNDQMIYLHDTPAGHLFEENNRTFSHGCVRVEKPIALAAYLLDWDRKKVIGYIKKEETKTVILDEEMPVHIVYWSAWVDEDGMINFRKDIYDHDKTQRQRIEQKTKSIASTPGPALQP